jgi:serine/threonine-protein kinase RsbW
MPNHALKHDGFTPSDSGRRSFHNDHVTSEAVQNEVVDSMERQGYSKASRFAVRLALAEAVANAFNHGHRALPESTPILVDWSVSRARVKIVVEDRGPGFKPEGVPDPTLDENIEVPTGRGLMLIRAYMTRVTHVGRGNQVEMVYDKPGG